MPSDRVYVFDTSSLCEVRRAVPTAARRKVWQAIKRLVDEGRLVFPLQVPEELAPHANPGNDEVFDWTSENSETAAGSERLEGDVASMLKEHPEVSQVIDDEKEGVDEADPYVLALARKLQAEGRNVTVVTQEHRDRPRKLSLGSACGMLGITSLPLLPFLSVEGVWKPRD